MKKILIVSGEPTHPTIGGSRTCILSYSSMLKDMGYEVGFLFTHQSWWQPQEWIDEMSAFWKDKLYIHKQSKIKDHLQHITQTKILFNLRKKYSLDGTCPQSLPLFVNKVVYGNGYDTVILNYWNFSHIFLSLGKHIKKIIYTHDKFSDRYHRTNSDLLSTDKKTEGAAFDRADEVLAIQQCEADFFRTITKTSVRTVYSYFPLNPLPISINNNILFFSGPNQFNCESLKWFVLDVFPLVQKVVPQVQLNVGGKICSVLDKDVSSKTGVKLLGVFDSPADFYIKGMLSLNPVCEGSGLKIKTFESLSFGRNVISHSHSVEGIFNFENAPIVKADTAEDFAAEIIRRLLNPDILVKEYQRALSYIQELNQEVKRVFSLAIEK